MKRFVTALLFVFATSVSAFAQSLPIPSGWLNQRGSIMKLYAITPSGDFTGVYFNNAAGFQCRYGPNNPVPYNGQWARERQFGHFQCRVEQWHSKLQF